MESTSYSNKDGQITLKKEGDDWKQDDCFLEVLAVSNQ